MELLSYLFWATIFLHCYCRGVSGVFLQTDNQIADEKSIFQFVVTAKHRNELEHDGQVNIKLVQAFNHSPQPEYTIRGDIYIQSLRNGIARVEEVPLTEHQVKLLKELASKNFIYRLMATITSSEGKETYFTSFVKACDLIEGFMNNTITVNLDHNGNVIGVAMAVPNLCTGREVEDSVLMKMDTVVQVKHMELGPVPDTATYIQKLEREREAKERGEVKDNRSFLAKYWMYIVPVVIFMLLPSATNTESGGAAQR